MPGYGDVSLSVSSPDEGETPVLEVKRDEEVVHRIKAEKFLTNQ